jgi:tetratricopeptide (TPR) repeat protein
LKPAKSKAISKAKSPEYLRVVCVCVFLALAVLAVFGQTRRFEFVNYDDNENVYENPIVRKGLTFPAIGWAFTHAQVSNWIPLTTLSHMLDCQIFGLNAGGHHLVNVLWHAANTVLLFLLLRQMTASLWRAAFVAALFGVHPLRAESVAWVSERKDVLSAFFFILSIGAYLRHVRKPSTAGYVAVVLLFALGLLAKSMVATLPVVLLLLDYWPLGRLHDWAEFRQRLKEKIPLFALAAAACMATALMPGLVVNAHPVPFPERIGNALVSCVVYLRQMVFPAGLAASYPNAPDGQPMRKIFWSLVLLAGISAWVVAARKKRPFLLMGWLWYLAMLVPVIGIIQISKDAAHADRYTYLPGIGLAMAGTWAVADWSAGWKERRVILGGLMMAVLGALMVCGRMQTSYWLNSETLWTRTLACTSANALAHLRLGAAFGQKGQMEKAIEQYRDALEIKPDDAEIHSNLGSAFVKTGKLEEAIEQYRNALEIAPDDAEARNNLGFALFKKGELEDAIVQYRKAVEIAPDDAEARSNLGFALSKKGQLEEAIAQYRKALEIAPENAGALSNLGNALLLNGDLDGAINCLKKAAAINPDQVETWYNLGNGFLQRGELDQAIASYQQAIKINPRYADTCANLGVAYFKEGQTRQAMDSWQQALEINPGQLYVQNNLAWLLATTPDASLRNGSKAITLAAQANEMSGGGNPTILHTLAAAYAEAGSYNLAATTARRGLELALEQKNYTLAATLQNEIKLYEADSPVRDTGR